MLLLEREILGYLSDNWSQAAVISWTNFNVSVNYDANQEYLVPFLKNLDSEILETPAESAAVRRDYAVSYTHLTLPTIYSV